MSTNLNNNCGIIEEDLTSQVFVTTITWFIFSVAFPSTSRDTRGPNIMRSQGRTSARIFGTSWFLGSQPRTMHKINICSPGDGRQAALWCITAVYSWSFVKKFMLFCESLDLPVHMACARMRAFLYKLDKIWKFCALTSKVTHLLRILNVCLAAPARQWSAATCSYLSGSAAAGSLACFSLFTIIWLCSLRDFLLVCKILKTPVKAVKDKNTCWSCWSAFAWK